MLYRRIKMRFTKLQLAAIFIILIMVLSAVVGFLLPLFM